MRVGRFRFRLAVGLGALAFLGAWAAELPSASQPTGASGPRGSPASGFRVDVWQTEEGLPHNTVTAVLQTTDGYLWVGTQGGLVRFDGVRFTVFDTHNTPSFPSDRIVQLHQDPGGTLWIGTELGGVVAARQGQFEVYRAPGLGTAHNYARAFASGTTDKLWMVTCEWQTLRFDRGQFVRELEPLLGQQCFSAAGDLQDQWIGTSSALFRRHQGDWKPVWTTAQEPGFRVEVLASARAGGSWVAANRRLRRFAGNAWVEDRGGYTWTNRPVYALHEDSSGQVWVATLGAGVHRFGPTEVLSLTTADGLPTDLIRCVTEDREGNVWLGTEGGGLCRLKSSPFQVLGKREGLPSEQVLSVSESADGSLWVGTNGDGLTQLRGNQVTRFGPDQGLDNGHVWSVLADTQGTIWAGTWGGLFAQHPDGSFGLRSDFTRISGQVLGLFADQPGSVWVGQQGLGGVARLDQGRPVVPPLPGLPDAEDVRAMAQTPDGSRWFGTSGHGLIRWRDGVVTRYGRTNQLGADTIWALHVDHTGTLWVGTYRGGLATFRDETWRIVTSEHGLPDSTICQILEDDQGHLWLGTYAGIWRVNRDALQRLLGGGTSPVSWFGLTKADGLPGIQCSGGFQPSGCRSQDGRLWFPTPKGLVVVDPVQVRRNPQPPPVRVELIRVDGRSIAIPTPGTTADRLKLPPGTRQLEFEFTALSLTAPAKVRFRHRLDPSPAQWSALGTTRAATYNLPGPGRYQFTVVAANPDGVWTPTGATTEFEVLPQFWETSWFALGTTLLGALTVAGTARHWVRRSWQQRLERAERERALERERARIARDLHDELGAGLTQVALLGELAGEEGAAPSDQRAHLDTLKFRSRQLTRSLDEIVWAVNPRCDSLASLASYLTQFAGEFLVTGQSRLRLDIPVDLPAHTLPVGVRHQLFLAVKEAFNNAAKHARATEISLRLRVVQNRLDLTVTDDGVGFDPATANPSRSGLSNLRQRLAEIGGTVTVHSAPGTGTRVEFRVPLPTREVESSQLDIAMRP